MKRKFYFSLVLMAYLSLCQADAYSQANTTLSNLIAPTNINQDLIPNLVNSKSLGTALKGWRKLYLDSSVYLGGLRFVSFGNNKTLRNTAIGNSALVLATGADNTGVGNIALNKTTSGINNTAVGSQALKANTIGKNQAAVGSLSLQANTTGINNNALGHATLYANTIGSDNNALGAFTMEKNTSGQSNVALGSFALHDNTSGGSNIAIGMRALFRNINGSNSVAVGDSALLNSTGNTKNVAVGSKAMYANSNGSYNTAVGHIALTANTTGTSNTAVGSNSMYSNTSGGSSTAAGYSSLPNMTTGSYNTGFGKYSLYYVTTQNYNTAVGYSAGDYYSGTTSTFLGAYASPSVNGFTNATAIGYNSIVTASNQIMLGNTAITSVKTAGSVVIYSDGRFKKDIEENVPGLEFINQLRPVTYHYDVHGMNDKIGGKRSGASRNTGLDQPVESNDEATARQAAEEQAIKEKEQKLYTGFVAQEVEEAAKKAKFDFSGVYKPQNDKDIYGLSYSEFVVPLVKAVQELSKKNTELEAEIQELKALIKDPNATGATISGASLSQNTPNPVKSNTTIAYSIPKKFRFAQIVMYDAYGQAIKQVKIPAVGRGTLNLNVASLAAGEYNYSLQVDGEVISTKKMILVR